MRYFLISYAHTIGFGHTFIAANRMPNIQKCANDAAKRDAVVVSIFEFKNERDWLDAQNKE